MNIFKFWDFNKYTYYKNLNIPTTRLRFENKHVLGREGSFAGGTPTWLKFKVDAIALVINNRTYLH